jgi:DNA-binding NtrC family response regulator
VLVIDDDSIFAGSLVELFARHGHDALAAGDGEEAVRLLDEARESGRPFDIATCDLGLPDIDGHELIAKMVRAHPRMPIVVLTGLESVAAAVEALRLGAADYLTKPVVGAELMGSVERALRQRALCEGEPAAQTPAGEVDPLAVVLGDDPRIAKVLDIVRSVAPVKTTILMTGESGTGKSMLAHAVHKLSPRRARPFVELSCGSIPETLLESELFGHVKGAFTGAHADKVGRFLAADGGTLFLDEINSASPAMQLKLLRVLQERRFEPVGSSQTIEVDVRVVLATNQPLEELVAAGLFRQDLYYRINVITIQLPPLRARRGDVPLLAEGFLRKHAAELSRQIVGFSAGAMAAITAYPFPGNIRELANIVEHAAVLSKGQVIELDDLPEYVRGGSHTAAVPARADVMADRAADTPWVPMTLEEAMKEPEKQILMRALRTNEWNRQRTAEQLGINRTTLYKKMKSLGIDLSEAA